MKKRIAIFLLVCMALTALAGCSNKQEANTIALKPLTADQEEILALLGETDREIAMFSYHIAPPYRELEIYLEAYHYGELDVPPGYGNITDSRAAGFRVFAQDRLTPNGDIVIIASQTDEATQWQLIAKDETGQSSYTTTYDLPEGVSMETMSRAYGPITEPAVIENGQEILLYSLFYSDGELYLYSGQEFLENAESLRAYPAAFLVKCRFSTSGENSNAFG